MSTGSGEVVPIVSGSSGFVSVPFYFLIFERCGSFFAFVAAPIIKTNFASRSLAIVWSACSLAWVSTLALVCVLSEFFNEFRILSSISLSFYSIFSSRIF
jgi:hypothetical protein